MIPCHGYAAPKAAAPLEPFRFERREPGENDVLIDVLFCGICHSDIHAARGEWGEAQFPMVPGHEIVGRVQKAGRRATRFKAGDLVGVGCFVDSCRTCPSCAEGEEPYCADGPTWTYNARGKDGVPTYGGYSSAIVVDERYVLRIPAGLSPEKAAPLLCAGITTYSPLRRWKAGPSRRVGVVGLGGLGHMAVKLAVAMGAEVTVVSRSPAKEKDALRLGAKGYLASAGDGLAKAAQSLDLILDTVSGAHALDPLMGLLKRDGTLVMVGASPDPLEVSAFSLILRRRSLAGSLIGGIRETQEMLDYCAEKKITPDIEVLPLSQVNTAWDRVVKSDVRYRAVLSIGDALN